ncbi:tyrosine-type recombinase/integrase [Lachnospiraceae bacterium 47-T17]
MLRIDNHIFFLIRYPVQSDLFSLIAGSQHTTATHMLEAGVPIMAIKNFLGHSSISAAERYAELSQGTVNGHIRDWSEKWFSHQKENCIV